MTSPNAMLLNTENRSHLSATPVPVTIKGLLLARTALLDGLLVSRARAALHGAVRHELAGLCRLVHGLSHRNFLLSSFKNYLVVIRSISYLNFGHALGRAKVIHRRLGSISPPRPLIHKIHIYPHDQHHLTDVNYVLSSGWLALPMLGAPASARAPMYAGRGIQGGVA